MSPITELATQLEQTYAQLLNEVETEKADQVKSRKVLVDRKKDLDLREEALSVRETELKKLAADTEMKVSKIRTDEQVQNQSNETLLLKDEVDKKLKSALDHEAEAELKLTWVADREKAVSEREVTYKQKIEKEYQEKLKGLIK